MISKREEKLADKLHKLQEEIKAIRKELHTCKQKNRDMEKSRTKHKEQMVIQEQTINRLKDELKKKL